MKSSHIDYDYVVIGSGFGGSVSAYRLAQKGYSVLVLEQGQHKKAEDFAKSNWNLRKWLWVPFLKFYGIFKVTFFRHITVLSGTGVGGGSLVYANTLPVPKKPFFESKSWAHLANWQKELRPHYETALTMLGAVPNPKMFAADRALQNMSESMGLGSEFSPTDVAVFFAEDGQEGQSFKDPFFKGAGPDRTSCTYCGACMVGCRVGAKNTLDKNYLYLAQKLSAKISAESKVIDVKPHSNGGYKITYKKSTRLFGKKRIVRSHGVVFAAGVLGTIKLLTELKKSSLPKLSNLVGRSIRTNNESLLTVISAKQQENFSKGVAIGSITHTDENSHLEPVRYPSGSGFWRTTFWPAALGSNLLVRLAKTMYAFLRHPIRHLKILLVRDWAESSQTLLFMQTLDSTLSFKKGLFGLKSAVDTGAKPTPFIDEAHQVAKLFAKQIDGEVYQPNTETLFATPTTAHILGGACMGKDITEGVIDKDNKVFGYENMLVCDGSMISANPGVNPSLTITAISERAMSKIKSKKRATQKKRTKATA